MHITTVLAEIPVRDMTSSTEWFTRLLGREPDERPMDGLAEWRFTEQHMLQVVADDDRAGGGVVTLVVSDIAAARDELA
jgi:hypothetical protein